MLVGARRHMTAELRALIVLSGTDEGDAGLVAARLADGESVADVAADLEMQWTDRKSVV